MIKVLFSDEKESQVCQCALSSEELEEQHPPLASTPGSQQPPPLMPIAIGDSAIQDLSLQVGAADLSFNNSKYIQS